MNYRTWSEKIINMVEIDWSEKESQYEICVYGLEIFLSCIVNLLLVIALACILDIKKEALVYIVFFVPLRMFSGGIHAKSHGKCIGYFILCMLAAIYTAKAVYTWEVLTIVIPCLLIVIVGIVCLLGGKYKSKAGHKKISKMIIIDDAAIILFMLCLSSGMRFFGTIAVFALLIQSLTLVIKEFAVWANGTADKHL